MLRHAAVGLVCLFLFAGQLLAADKEATGKVFKVDAAKKVITVTVDGQQKEYTVNDDTKFLGPKGGVSKTGIKDDRFKPGAEVKIVIAGNNKTLRQIQLVDKKK